MNGNHKLILYRARGLIRDHQEGMVCLAIQRVIGKYPHLKEEGEYLQDYIMIQLCGHGSLHTWQHFRGISHSFEERRQDRINWISWMLGEL